MTHAVDHVGRLGMGRRLGGLEAPPLVESHVDDHRAVARLAEHLAGHQLWRRGTRNKHRSDHQVGVQDVILDRAGDGCAGGIRNSDMIY